MNDPAGLYIHVPFCRSRCGYCAFYSMARKPDENYVNALLEEMRLRAPLLKGEVCDTLYFGGGTPSLLPVGDVRHVLEGVRKNFTLSDEAEITMEMNPCDMNAPYLKEIHDLGINRISVGVQSNQGRLLRAIGRQHTASEAEAAVKRAYHLGFHNISIDLMDELPGQSVEDFHKTLLWAVHLPITHLSVYSLILEEGTRFFALNRQGKLPRPTEEESWAMYQDMCRTLPHYGFRRYEISSFARKGFESRHNLKYWKLDNYLGLGPSASSRIGRDRFTDDPGLRLYEKNLLSGELPPTTVEHLSEKDEMEEYCFLHLRMRTGIPLDEFKERYGEDITCWYGEQIHDLLKEKLIRINEGHLFLTYHGAALGNYVFEQFLRDE